MITKVRSNLLSGPSQHCSLVVCNSNSSSSSVTTMPGDDAHDRFINNNQHTASDILHLNNQPITATSAHDHCQLDCPLISGSARQQTSDSSSSSAAARDSRHSIIQTTTKSHCCLSPPIRPPLLDRSSASGTTSFHTDNNNNNNSQFATHNSATMSPPNYHNDQLQFSTTGSQSPVSKMMTLAAGNSKLVLVKTATLIYIVALLFHMLIIQSMPLMSIATHSVGVEAASESRIYQHSADENTNEFWELKGKKALDEALRYQVNVGRAKSSIIFVGDGMSLSTITAARILHGQMYHNRSGEEDGLSFESFPNLALVKTYNVDQQVPDSAATATAILCGIKSNFYTLGVNANVRLNDTDCQNIQRNHVQSIIQKAIKAGKSTGIVTNTRITHATPAAAYAHVSNRRWECDTYVPKNLDSKCKDIARQLIEDEPGNKINVIMGGGRRCFFGGEALDPKDPHSPGMRKDKRNLVEQWVNQRQQENQSNYAFVNSTRHLREIDLDKTDYLLGLFSYSHMSYEELRDQSLEGEPSLAEMTETAIKILQKNPKGYILLVEGGRIDHAHHENVAGVALRETISFSQAIQRAVELVDVSDTLITVTSDHAHALTINGLAPRGNSILGLSRFNENSTGKPYTTLIYGNGPGNHYPRSDPSQQDNNSDQTAFYVQHAAIHQEEAFHDGTDVAVFSVGPHAHLFQGVQEQSYIAHVINYATCMGGIDGPHCNDASNNGHFNGHSNNNNNNNNNILSNNNLRLRASSGGTTNSSFSIALAYSTILVSMMSSTLLALLLVHL